MIVLDASVAVPALADDATDGGRARARLRGESLIAPEVFDIEVVSALRRLVAGRQLTARRANAALKDLALLPVARVSHVRLLDRVWQLRSSLTPYDAAYVAVAELSGAVLLTADRRLAGAPGSRCTIEVLR